MITKHATRLPRRRARAFTMIEVALTVFLLAIAMTATVQVLGWVAAERRAVERRQWAVQEVANVMERLTAEPWDRDRRPPGAPVTPGCTRRHRREPGRGRRAGGAARAGASRGSDRRLRGARPRHRTHPEPRRRDRTTRDLRSPVLPGPALHDP